MGRPGFSFLVCDDSELLKEEIDRQIARYEPAAAGWKRVTFWGDEELDDRFWSSLDQAGLFAENKIVIVRRADQFSGQFWENVSGRLARELGHVWPFFCLEMPGDGNEPKVPAAIQKTSCYVYADKQKWIWRPGRRDIAARLAGEIRKRGLIFDPGCLEIFTAYGRSCQWSQIINELDKLALLAEDGKVTRELMAAGQYEPESGAFAIVNAIRAGDLHAALKEAASDADDNLLFFALAVLDRELREKWKSLPEMASSPGARPWQSRKPSGRPLSAGELGAAFAALAEAEWRVKSGQAAPHHGLEFLCDRLTGIFAPAR